MPYRDNDPISNGPLNVAPLGYAPNAEQRAALFAELDNAGVELGAYDRRIVDWIAGWDYPTVATIASLIRRAAHRPH
ncbi:hypothetical protein PV416_47495 [Streptomyces ipomoeae]|uniref:hypothetical protein n=1 Tax=Streptomyces ipomoeae TaxID=103232 RepID=UPI0011468E8D|nr:hypothetical protein [Streptomyces ipomoeae]MDX2828495.1 hypothetical protein [Streptomyces ipomoeae]MDX2880979.1 hypothetical protein [Streptomyces ipomoeae]TQE38121.1 hypothetical protein Sipo7851_06990 [Streptomyces ipomoeae]